MKATPFWLMQGFRPFFVGAGVWAALAMIHWLHLLAGHDAGTSALSPLQWHRHEMIFGYGGAALGGFLLTAIPNWTGRLPVRGLPLLALFSLWCAGRLANLASAHLGATTAMLIDALYWAALIATILRELLAGKNRRNLPVAGLVALVGIASTLDHTGVEWAWRLGLAAILTLILLVGGRVIPSFTRNWLVKQQSETLPAPFATYDKIALAGGVVALLTWVIVPDEPVAGAFLIVASLLHATRLARWKGALTLREPLLTILHVGYGWVVLGLFLTGLAVFLPSLPLSPVHALTAGGVAVMTVAVMSRASLGHSGRELHAGPALSTVYALINLGAVLRVTADLLPLRYDLSINIAGAIWISGFLLYVAIFLPMWLRPRRAASARQTGIS